MRMHREERERKREREAQRHRQREKQAPCREPDVGLDPGSPGSHPRLQAALNRCTTGAALSPSILNETLAGYSIWGCMFFSFKTLNISCQPFWPARSLWRGLLLIFLPIKLRDFLSLAALRIFSLSLEFASFTIKC